MPPLDEGSLLYMPSTMPGISIAEAQKLLQVTDRIIKQFPEVDRVLGKAGRAETSTDPAPLSMLETVITLKPQVGVAPRRHLVFRAGRRSGLKPVFRHITPDPISPEELVDQMNAGAEDSRRLQRLDDADQGAHRHADHRHPDAGRAEDLRRGPRRRSRRSAPQIEAAAALGAGDAQRLRRAHRRRLLPRLRVEPRRAGALRPEHRRGAGGRCRTPSAART